MMGKEKKVKRHQSLTQQIIDADAPRSRSQKRFKSKTREEEEGHGVSHDYVEGRLSHKILEQVRLQQEELEEEVGTGTTSVSSKMRKKRGRMKSGGLGTGLARMGMGLARIGTDDGNSENSSGSDDDASEEEERCDVCPVIAEEDERAMERFMCRDEKPRRTLASLIQDKIRDKETELLTHMTEASVTGVSAATNMDERAVSLFTSVAKILSKYRSGKLPKAFKIIPSLSNWEEVLYTTEPENWSAAAMFQATKIFASNLRSPKAQKFFNLVLLPRVRDDIAEYKRLNFHLYMALKKALFKPAGFFKGILLPLCESGTCTLREALIIGSVLAKVSIPMLHSSAALLKIAEMDYAGANSIFLRILLDKKYALPYRVVDSVVFHFLRFTSDKRELPVLWHQSLLAFVQHYKEDVAVEQKEGLLELIRNKSHRDITPEIRREIVNSSRCRDSEKIIEKMTS